ncbi:peptidase inhibitor family I36 protein [Micromonospora sp. NPDC049275]|uniref:peptidase inhibitor family I36 protein n=1 Tax=Micromonospora sp. NPDC049275 TaxID=3364268 RepID=UPI003712BEC9
MATPRPLRTMLVAVLSCLLIVVPAPGRAGAAATDGPEMAAYLAAHPGGKAISDNEISYDGGAFVVTLRRPIGTLVAADCPSGWYCFYEWPNYGYPRGRLSDCGRQSLATWNWQFRVESAHYNLGSGTVSFYYYDTRLFDIGASSRVRSDASPFRNWPNYVQRRC